MAEEQIVFYNGVGKSRNRKHQSLSDMDLDKQIRELIEQAPQDGVTPQGVAAIAPVLKLLASRMRQTDYYVLQTLDRDWVVTTLSNRQQPEVEKNVVYAFATLKDAIKFQRSLSKNIVGSQMPIVHILFQLLAMDTVDSLIAFDLPGNLVSGTEIRRQDLQNLIEIQLQQESRSRNIPPDIA
jgi:hypothetical protein